MRLKVRTYGISRETAGKLMDTIFTDFYLKAKKVESKDLTSGMMVDLLEAYPEQCRMLILSSAVFAIGNFDRIDKVAMWGKVDDRGLIDNSTLEEIKPNFIS